MIDAERAKVLLVRSKGNDPLRRGQPGARDARHRGVDARRRPPRRRSASASGRWPSPAVAQCDDLEAFPAIDTVADPACATCLADGTRWVSLRQCLECGHVGCCDSSIGKHATAHFHETLHPVMESAQPDESWRWCFVHNLTG